jgi:hypothetical protein
VIWFGVNLGQKIGRKYCIARSLAGLKPNLAKELRLSRALMTTRASFNGDKVVGLEFSAEN